MDSMGYYKNENGDTVYGFVSEEARQKHYNQMAEIEFEKAERDFEERLLLREALEVERMSDGVY